MSPKITPPKCADCGTRQCHPVCVIPGVGLNPGSYVWLCGACEILRSNPEAPRRVLMPAERRVPKQKEVLF